MEESKIQCQNTTSSTFYQGVNSKDKHPSLSQQSWSIEDKTLLIKLENQIAKLKLDLYNNSQDLQKLDSRKELKIFIESLFDKLTKLKQSQEVQTAENKKQFEELVSQLMRDLQKIKKQWKKIKENCENQLTSEITLAKEEIRKNEQNVQRQLKKCSKHLKQKVSVFNLESKDLKRQRLLSRRSIFDSLQTLRIKIASNSEEEIFKRNEYEDILFGLIEKTCEKSQIMTRRKVY